MAEASGVGLDIDLKKIPIRQETVEICEYFDINPYELISSGCMLMAAPDGNGLVMALERAGSPATIIGKATEGNDRRGETLPGTAQNRSALSGNVICKKREDRQ